MSQHKFLPAHRHAHNVCPYPCFKKRFFHSSSSSCACVSRVCVCMLFGGAYYIVGSMRWCCDFSLPTYNPSIHIHSLCVLCTVVGRLFCSHIYPTFSFCPTQPLYTTAVCCVCQIYIRIHTYNMKYSN